MSSGCRWSESDDLSTHSHSVDNFRPENRDGMNENNTFDRYNHTESMIERYEMQ